MKQGKKIGIMAYIRMFFFCILLSAVVSLVLLVLTSVLMERANLSEKSVTYIIWGIYVLGGFASGMLAGKWRREKKFIWGMIAGGIWFMVILLISLVYQKSNIQLNALTTGFVCMLSGGLLGGMFA